MATANYASKLATAQRLIDKFGELATLRTFPVGTTDSDMPWKREAATPDLYTDTEDVSMVFLNYGQDNKLPERYADGTLSKTGDKRVLIAPGAVGPKLTDQLIRVSGEVWQIKSIKTLDPAEVTLLYELGVTR